MNLTNGSLTILVNKFLHHTMKIQIILNKHKKDYDILNKRLFSLNEYLQNN